jgi:TPR repeat protein
MHILPSHSQRYSMGFVRIQQGVPLRFGMLDEEDGLDDDGYDTPYKMPWDETGERPWEQEFSSLPWKQAEDKSDSYVGSTPFLEEAFKAWHYYEVEGLAKVQGQIDAQLELAWRNKTGLKAPWGQKNPELAEKWFREVAMQGDALGQYYLARFLLQDKPVEKTISHRAWEFFTRKRQATPTEIEACMWFELASAQKHCNLQEVYEATKELRLMTLWMPPNALLKAKHKAQETAGAINFLKWVEGEETQ